MWYRYQKAIGDFLLWGIGTSFLGTGTNRLLHVGTGTIVCGTGTAVSANAPLHSNTSRDFLTAAAVNCNDYIRSLDTNSYKKYARNSKNLHKHKKHENGQRHLLLHNMRAKYEPKVLKSNINVALLCIQHTP